MRIPKLAPDTIRRERIVSWLAEYADVPLRLVVAPPGSGKTTALVTYAQQARYTAGYIALDAATSPERFRMVLSRAFGFPPIPDDDALLSAFAMTGRCEVLVDEVDRAPEALRETLHRFVVDAPENVTFVFGSRTREVVDTTRLLARGLCLMLDAERLAFTVDEAARFAEASRLVAGERDIARLVHDTEGWAFALCSAIRDAASSGRPLDGAFDRWRRAHARHVRTFVDDALADDDELLGVAARKYLDGEAIDEAILERLEARGLFVRWAEGAYRPYRAVARAARIAPAEAPRRTLTPFTVRLFGAPEVRLEGQRVAWFRRRDQQLFAYLALSERGRATRTQLVRAFWPEADPPLAAQSLRSACSTMRRSLAAIVGYSDLNHYVNFGDEIALNLDLFAIDARRVAAHLRDGETAWSGGDVLTAIEHDRAALRLAKEDFLGGDVPSPLRPAAGWFDGALARARERAAEERALIASA